MVADYGDSNGDGEKQNLCTTPGDIIHIIVCVDGALCNRIEIVLPEGVLPGGPGGK